VSDHYGSGQRVLTPGGMMMASFHSWVRREGILRRNGRQNFPDIAPTWVTRLTQVNRVSSRRSYSQHVFLAVDHGWDWQLALVELRHLNSEPVIKLLDNSKLCSNSPMPSAMTAKSSLVRTTATPPCSSNSLTTSPDYECIVEGLVFGASFRCGEPNISRASSAFSKPLKTALPELNHLTVKWRINSINKAFGLVKGPLPWTG